MRWVRVRVRVRVRVKVMVARRWHLVGLGCLWMCPRQVVVRYVDAVIPLGVALSWALLYDDLSSQCAL